jgi:hypothetical protein
MTIYLLGARRDAKNRWSGWSQRRSLSHASAACARDAASCRSRHAGVHAAAFSLYDAAAKAGSHIPVTRGPGGVVGALGFAPPLWPTTPENGSRFQPPPDDDSLIRTGKIIYPPALNLRIAWKGSGR